MRESAFREADKTAVRRSMTRASRPTMTNFNFCGDCLVTNLFIENRIKKEYRNDKIVRIKDKRSGGRDSAKSKVFPEIEGNKYYSFTER